MNDSIDYTSCIPSDKKKEFILDGVLNQMEEEENNMSDESDNEEGLIIRRRVVRYNDGEYSRLERGEHSQDNGESSLFMPSE